MIQTSNNCEKNLKEINRILTFQSEFFDIVRLVDPVEKVVYIINNNTNELTKEKYDCYAFWKTGKTCDNCISMRTINQKKSLNKFEFLDDLIYYITTSYVEINGKSYVIEMIKNITDSILIDGFTKDGHSGLIEKIIQFNKSIITDPLTNIYNRRFLDESVPSLISRYHNKTSCAFIMADIDNFKNVNDTYGHDTGDQVLKAIANYYKETIRIEDFVIRFGGEEFFIVLVNIEPEEAILKMQSICEGSSKIEIPYKDTTISVTSSFGLCFLNEFETPTVSDIIKLSDTRLYKAKETGKNKVIFE